MRTQTDFKAQSLGGGAEISPSRAVRTAAG